MANELKPCPFCKKTMMLRSALWPSEGDADAIIHANPTDCPMLDFGDGSVDGSIIGKWNCSLSDEDDFPSDGSCVRCGSVPRNANGLCNTCLDEDAGLLDNTRPAAPVEGLERLDLQSDGWNSSDVYMGVDVNGDYVRFSQAEAIIAAERNRAEVAEYKLDQAFNTVQPMIIQRAERAEADNAALTARVKELEETVRDDVKFAQSLETKLAAAKKALRNIAEDEGAPFRIKVHALATLEIIYDPH